MLVALKTYSSKLGSCTSPSAPQDTNASISPDQGRGPFGTQILDLPFPLAPPRRIGMPGSRGEFTRVRLSSGQGSDARRCRLKWAFGTCTQRCQGKRYYCCEEFPFLTVWGEITRSLDFDEDALFSQCILCIPIHVVLLAYVHSKSTFSATFFRMKFGLCLDWEQNFAVLTV